VQIEAPTEEFLREFGFAPATAERRSPDPA
jgi:hypothetical protein